MPLFLLLLVVPLIEIALFIQVGGAIGVWPTVAIVLVTAIVGATMLRRQGLAALTGFRARLLAGENPGKLVAEGAMILVSGLLLLTPGFLTDAIGLLLLVPAVRGAIWRGIASRLVVVAMGGAGARAGAQPWPGGGPGDRQGPGRGPGYGPGHGPARGQTVEGEYEELDPDEERDTPRHRLDREPR